MAEKGEDRRSEVEGEEEETNVGRRRTGMKRRRVKEIGRPKFCHLGERKKNH